MTVRRTVRAAELTVAFSSQRKSKTMWFKSHPRKSSKDLVKSITKAFCNMKKAAALERLPELKILVKLSVPLLDCVNHDLQVVFRFRRVFR